MADSLTNRIEDKFVKYMYKRRLEDVARLAEIWHHDKDTAKRFESALDLLVSTHLSIRLRFPVLLPPDMPEDDEIPPGPCRIDYFDLSEGPGDGTATAFISALPPKRSLQ
jgi:hypothetical protein